MPIYPNSENAIIFDDHYKNLMDKKNRKVLRIKRTQTFEGLQGFEFDILTKHVWTKTDKLFHLSRKFYGTNDYWWIIGLLNGKPTDGHYSIGDEVLIPRKPLRVLEAIE